MFNAINRARMDPIAFADEMNGIGNTLAALAVAGMSSTSQLAYTDLLRQIASELFTGGKQNDISPLFSQFRI